MKIKLSASAIMLMSALYYFGSFELISAIAAAAFVHEMGHFTALRVFGGSVCRIEMTAAGFNMNISGLSGKTQELVCTAAGPFAGLCFAYVFSCASNMWGSKWLGMCAGYSYVFTVFNLLPVYPLDGGRMLKIIMQLVSGEKSQAICESAGLIVSLVITLAGLVLLYKGRGGAVLLAGIYTLILQLLL